VEVPEVRRNWLQFEAFVADPAGHPLKTRSGRIEISSETIASFDVEDCPGHPVWREPIEWLGSPDAEGMVHLVSGQPMTRLHGQLDNGPVSRANKVAGREAVYLHPSTAAAYGVADGDAVLLENARGRALAGAVLTDNVRPDVAWMATGAWFDPQLVDGAVIDVHGNPNTLTLDIGCSGLSQGNSAHTTLVRVSRWTGLLPEVTAHQPPQIERRR
jgi:biotin/methionine sulfoxide reductase